MLQIVESTLFYLIFLYEIGEIWFIKKQKNVMLCQLQYMYSTLMYICRILKPNCNSYYFNIVNPVIFLSYIFYSYWGVCCPSDRPVKGCDSNLGQVFYCRGRDTDHLTNTPPPLAHYTSTRPQHLRH